MRSPRLRRALPHAKPSTFELERLARYFQRLSVAARPPAAQRHVLTWYMHRSDGKALCVFTGSSYYPS